MEDNIVNFSLKKCATCRYWDKAAGDKMAAANLKNPMGACKYQPPVPTVLPTPNGLQVVAMFPMTPEEAWCGQHEFKEQKA